MVAGSSGKHRHALDATPDTERTAPTVAVISGQLPLPPVPEPASEWQEAVALLRAAEPEGQDASEVPPEPRVPEARRPVERTKVTLGEPVVPEPEEDVRVYVAPPLDGLAGFDLGSVPASVTPPRSWRKAAWFATVSSGGVAVALVLAGSMLVGQPAENDQAYDGWAGFDGKQPPVVGYDAYPAPDREGASRSIASSTDGPPQYRDLAGVHPSGAPDGSSGSSPGGSPTITVAPTSGPTTTQTPEKPPPQDAPRETRSDAVYRFPPNAETMGDRSEIFLNEVTENPERAHEQTGGDLYAEGADSIAARYAHIAYFEITHIYIDQKNRQTINSVEIVYTDGTRESGQRTLKFEEGDKITSD